MCERLGTRGVGTYPTPRRWDWPIRQGMFLLLAWVTLAVGAAQVAGQAPVFFGFDTDLEGWTRYNASVTIAHDRGQLIQTFNDHPTEWYPIIQSPQLNYDGDANQEVAISIKVLRAPVETIPCRLIYWTDAGYGVAPFTCHGGAQIVRFNAQDVHNEGVDHSGVIRSFRLDMPMKNQADYQTYAQTEIRIDWISISNCPEMIPADQDRQYVLVNFSPMKTPASQVFAEINQLLPAQRGTRVRIGAAAIFYAYNGANSLHSNVSLLQNFLDLAVETNTPVLVQVDTENWLDGRPDLWNWWDPTAPGYDDSNRYNVEWTSWNPADAIKVSWRNWGRQLRVKPHPNLMSPAFRTLCHEAYELYIPIILQWYESLPESKKHLFVGYKVGWESAVGPNAFHYPNGNSYYETWPDDESHDPTYGLSATNPPAYGVQQIGYAAASTAGIKTSGTITESDLAQIAGLHLADLAQKAMQLGLPRDKVFTHTWHLWQQSGLNAIVAVNDYSCPGWSAYTGTTLNLRAERPDIDAAVLSSTAPYWAAVETLYQGPWSTVNWHRYLRHSLDPQCRFLTIYNWDHIDAEPDVLDALDLVSGESVVGWQSFADEDFEGGWGVFQAGNALADIYSQAAHVYDGAFALRLRGPDGWGALADPVDLSPGYNRQRIEFWYTATGLTNGEGLDVFYDDGTSEHIVASLRYPNDIENAAFGHYSITFDSDQYPFSNTAKIGFRCIGTASNDAIYIDNVKYRTIFNIQQAVDTTPPGGTVTVGPGRYCESVDLAGKDITLTSTVPGDFDVVAETVIDAEGQGSVISMTAAAEPAQISGLTLTGGYAQDGAGIHVDARPVTLSRCVVHDNLATGLGGGVYADEAATVALDRCLAFNNSAIHGGGVYLRDSNLMLANVTLSDNVASSKGGAVRAYGAVDVTIRDSIIWGNHALTGMQLALRDGTYEVQHSDVEGAVSDILLEGAATLDWGVGNLDIDPLFAAPADKDYHLLSQAGRRVPHSWCYTLDQQTSRAIDAASPARTLDAESASLDNTRRNLGAYGGSEHASLSPPNWSLAGDIDNSGIVDGQDLAHLLATWLSNGADHHADVSRDGYVDLADLPFFTSDWLNMTMWYTP